MNRNSYSHFADNPTNIDISRSTFDLDHVVKFSGNVGDCIPFDVIEVLPGDTFSIDTNKVVRLQTMLTPIMDNMYLDTYYFFVPNRIVWDHWKQFMGENTDSYWIPQTEYAVPTLKAPSAGWSVGTIADYMGIPVNVPNIAVNALPFRAYAVIMNEWFRDENLTPYLNIYTGDAQKNGSNGSDDTNDIALGGKPFKAAKFKDYFTSCLPSPQKGPDVALPSGYVNLEAEVVADNRFNSYLSPDHTYAKWFTPTGSYSNMNLVRMVTTPVTAGFVTTGSTDYIVNPQNLGIIADQNTSVNNVFAGTVNELRLAFQIQKLYEKDARGGTRYIEQLRSHFGVTSPDARLQRPEYLGGNRIPIVVHQVANTAESNSGSLGNVGAFSFTTDSNSDFTKSFVEHGFIIGIAVVRYDHTYAQGLERFWRRSDRFDYYWPVFANIGEQAVKCSEIYCTGVPSNDDSTFGYQEAWADYRYKPDRVAGEMRPGIDNTLASWHLADDYAQSPFLSNNWIREDKTNVDRVLAVTSSVSNQFFCDFYIKTKATRPMPLYSIPGLIDHH